MGSGTRQVFEQALHYWGIALDSLNVILELSSGEMVKAVVESGIGATAISELMVRKEVQFGLLKVLRVREPRCHNTHSNQKGISPRCSERLPYSSTRSGFKRIWLKRLSNC